MAKRAARSSPYPFYSIEYCLDLVTKIYSNFGSGNYWAKREEIAQVLGISTGHVQTQVSSATQYGLLDLKQGEGYKPSELFRQIYKPIEENSKKDALVKVFKSPPLYSALIERFENEILPAIVPLTNLLIHHQNISDVAAEKAASIFIENAKNLGFLNAENVLSFNSINNAESNSFEDFNDENDIVAENSQTFVNNLPVQIERTQINPKTEFSDRFISSPIPFNIPLKGSRTAQIVVPFDVKSTDFDFIINFINLMKQQYD